jgi:uncharacterized membrane protein HdeD (DUF308 family)
MTSISYSKSRIAGLLASILLIVGALVPWSESMGIPFSRMEYGYFVLGFGILSFLYLLKKRIRFIFPLLFGIATLVVGSFYLYKVRQSNFSFPGEMSDFPFGGLAIIHFSYGIALIILGGITLVVLALINRKKLF